MKKITKLSLFLFLLTIMGWSLYRWLKVEPRSIGPLPSTPSPTTIVANSLDQAKKHFSKQWRSQLSKEPNWSHGIPKVLALYRRNKHNLFFDKNEYYQLLANQMKTLIPFFNQSLLDEQFAKRLPKDFNYLTQSPAIITERLELFDHIKMLFSMTITPQEHQSLTKLLVEIITTPLPMDLSPSQLNALLGEKFDAMKIISRYSPHKAKFLLKSTHPSLRKIKPILRLAQKTL